MESKDIGWGVNLDEVVIRKELGCRMYAAYVFVFINLVYNILGMHWGCPWTA
jgi:hypothetical protein